MFENFTDEKKKEYLAELESKKTVEFLESFTTLTMRAFLKENVEKHYLSNSKLGTIFWSAFTAEMCVSMLLVCMIYAMVTNEDGDYTPDVAHSYMLFLVKIPCATALHLLLSPQVTNALRIMHYANQQEQLFIDYGSHITYFLGFHAAVNALTCQAINIYMLTYQHTIQHSIIHFVALEVVMEFTKLYYESLVDFKLKELMEEPCHRPRAGKDIVFSERSCFHKFARIFYRLLRIFYVSVVYYFIPYSVVLNHWLTPDKFAAEKEGAEGGE